MLGKLIKLVVGLDGVSIPPTCSLIVGLPGFEQFPGGFCAVVLGLFRLYVNFCKLRFIDVLYPYCRMMSSRSQAQVIQLSFSLRDS